MFQHTLFIFTHMSYVYSYQGALWFHAIFPILSAYSCCAFFVFALTVRLHKCEILLGELEILPELYAFRAILTVLLWKPGGFSGTNWFQGGHYGWLKVPRVAISKYLNLRKVVKSDAFVSGINHGLKMLAMRFHPTLTGSWYDAARFVATWLAKKLEEDILESWSLGGFGDRGAKRGLWDQDCQYCRNEVRNEALFVSVGYRSGFLGHWAHEELAKEDRFHHRITGDFDPVAVAFVQLFLWFVYLFLLFFPPFFATCLVLKFQQKTMSWIEIAGSRCCVLCGTFDHQTGEKKEKQCEFCLDLCICLSTRNLGGEICKRYTF